MQVCCTLQHSSLVYQGLKKGKKQLERELVTSEIIGKRVRFKSSNNPYSTLRFYDLGTITGVTNLSYHGEIQTKLQIRWDNGDNYTLMDGFDSLDIFADVGV